MRVRVQGVGVRTATMTRMKTRAIAPPPEDRFASPLDLLEALGLRNRSFLSALGAIRVWGLATWWWCVKFPERGFGVECLWCRVYPIITMIKWIRTSRLSIKNSLSLGFAE